MASLNGTEGTIGRLLNDEQTANSVVETIESAQGTFDNIEALTDEIERRLQRRLRLGFDRRGGFRGGGRSWPR